MLIVDTNVISELMRPSPSVQVIDWAQRTALEGVCTTSINEAEILVGIAGLPEGRRRDSLIAAARRLFTHLLGGRVLAFDSTSAREFARLMSARRRAGRPMQIFDAQIAAITAAHAATLVTRNVADFTGCGFEVLNPWGT